MKNTELAFCKFSKYPILKSIRVKFSRYKQKSMNVSVSFDTLILIYKNAPRGCALRRTRKMSQATAAGARMCQGTFFVLEQFEFIMKNKKK